MSHPTPQASGPRDLEEMYYPISKATIPSNRRESIFPPEEDSTSDVDQISQSLDRVNFEDANENPSTPRQIERDRPLPRLKPTHESMMAQATLMSDQAKHTRVDFQELKEKYLEGITLHNQLVDEMDRKTTS